MKKIIECCKSSKKHKLCKRKSDGKIFKLPRKFKKKKGVYLKKIKSKVLQCEVRVHHIKIAS